MGLLGATPYLGWDVHETDISDQYLSPPCRPSTLDSFGNRRLILSALRAALPGFHGVVLDVGCGHKPYRGLLLSPPSRAHRYIGLDLPKNAYSQPDVEWDGRAIPLPDAQADSCVLTEVLEHCPEPQAVLNEIYRVLRPGGFLFLTVPFIWPIHTVPHDEYRYTPFALARLLANAGFADVNIKATGGCHAVLGVTLGLWVRRRPLTSRVHLVIRKLLSGLLWPVIWLLFRIDRCPERFEESTMVVGLSAAGRKP
jgi:SAM-dependent methyltransferase